MGTPNTATVRPVLALSGSLMIVEIVIVLAIVALLAAVLVLYRRQNAPAKPSNQAPNPQSYYSNVETLGAPGAGAPPAGYGAPAPPAAPVAPPPAPAPAPPVVAPPPPAPAPAAPAPGTPAGWLPDPSGIADTLRYWDGTAWTQHVAQRS